MLLNPVHTRILYKGPKGMIFSLFPQFGMIETQWFTHKTSQFRDQIITLSFKSCETSVLIDIINICKEFVINNKRV